MCNANPFHYLHLYFINRIADERGISAGKS